MFGATVSTKGRLTRATEAVLEDLGFIINFVAAWLIIFQSFSEPIKQLETLLARIEKERIAINFKKFKLYRKETKFLEHIITTKGIKIDTEKVSIVRNYH